MWQQDDFLSGGLPVVFDNNSFATFRIGSSSTENLVNAQVRLLVREDTNYWLSQTAFTSPEANQSFTWNAANQGFSATSDGLWASFDPNKTLTGSVAGTDLRFDQSNATFQDKNFSSINAIGFFFEQDTFHNNLDFHFESFQVSATAVPEPSSLALLAGCGLLTAIRYRRRRASVTATEDASPSAVFTR